MGYESTGSMAYHVDINGTSGSTPAACNDNREDGLTWDTARQRNRYYSSSTGPLSGPRRAYLQRVTYSIATW